jgi:hypothetical protein
MNKLTKYLNKKSLSNFDILKLTGNNTKIITYPELSKYKTIDELLKPYGSCVILYLTKQDYGHWVCLIKQPNNVIEFFDSYGYPVDKQLKFVNEQLRKDLDTKTPHLSYLLYKSPYKVIFNDAKLQKLQKDINTCGKHVAMRILFKDIPIDEYTKILKSYKIPTDDLISLLTENI